MAYLHCWTQTKVPTPIQVPNSMATFYYAEHVHIDGLRFGSLCGQGSLIATVPVFGMDIRTRFVIRVHVRQYQ